MPINSPKELFVFMLSDVRRGAEQSTNFFRELHKLAQDPDVKEALEARLFVSDKIIEILDKCFEYVGEKPVKTTGRIYDVFVEDFRREFAEIQNPVAKRLFLLSKISRVIQLRIGEYVALIAAADYTQHHGVGVLLESCLADKLAFVERTRRLIRQQVRDKVASA
jgi:ferritin-like metal-binding protein YciE